MNIVKNEQLIQRNARLSGILTIVSLVILGAGMYLTFTRPELINWSIIALLVGFLLSQMGIYLTNRWGRKPRPDEMLDAALKGLNKQYTIYHYVLPAAHVLIGPAGIWVLIPKHQRGTITYSKNRWRQRGGGLLFAYLKMFAQEGLGRPDLEIDAETEGMQKFLKKQLPEMELPPIQAALVFFHPDVELQVDEAPVPALHAKKLKDFIRKMSKERSLSPEVVETVQNAIEA